MDNSSVNKNDMKKVKIIEADDSDGSDVEFSNDNKDKKLNNNNNSKQEINNVNEKVYRMSENEVDEEKPIKSSNKDENIPKLNNQTKSNISNPTTLHVITIKESILDLQNKFNQNNKTLIDEKDKALLIVKNGDYSAGIDEFKNLIRKSNSIEADDNFGDIKNQFIMKLYSNLSLC